MSLAVSGDVEEKRQAHKRAGWETCGSVGEPAAEIETASNSRVSNDD